VVVKLSTTELPVELNIINAHGQLVDQMSINKSVNRIFIELEGIYLFQFVHEDGYQHSERIVILE
jgi:hypothetical protein